MCSCAKGIGMGDFTDPTISESPYPVWEDSGAGTPSVDLTTIDYGGSGSPVFTGTVGAPDAQSPSFDWNSFLAQWTNIGGSILKSASGANPTYQASGPGGTVTVYGSQTGIPAALTSPFGTTGLSMGSILLYGGIAVAAVMLMSGKK